MTPRFHQSRHDFQSRTVYVKTNDPGGNRLKRRREVQRYILNDPIRPGAPVIMPTPELPTMPLRLAILVIILLHVVAATGVYWFNELRTRNLDEQPAPTAPPPSQIEEAPAPPPAPQRAEPASDEPLLVFAGKTTPNGGRRKAAGT